MSAGCAGQQLLQPAPPRPPAEGRRLAQARSSRSESLAELGRRQRPRPVLVPLCCEASCSGTSRRAAAAATAGPSCSALAASLVPLAALAARSAVGRRQGSLRSGPQGARRPRCARAAAAVAPAAEAAAGAAAAAPAAPEKLVLLGDSVLDNFYWLKTPQRPLRVQLAELLEAPPQQQQRPPPRDCVNFAVDQTTTFDLALRRPEENPWQAFAAARGKVNFADPQDSKYLTEEDGTLQPLRTLEGLENVTWVVLSVGGNDVYLRGDIQSALASSLLPPFSGRRQEVAEEFGQRLRGLVAEVRRAAPKAQLVLVIPYQPHNEFSLVMGAPVNAEGERIQGDLLGDFARNFERQVLSGLVTPMAKQILAVAREQGCPVIDLSKTLDPTAEEHYGTGRIGEVNELGVPWSGAEPSDVSSAWIARLIAHAVSREPKAVVYRGIPRREAGGQPSPTVLVREEANDVIFEEDYSFGPGGSGEKDYSNAPYWFSVGVALAVLVNVPMILDGAVFNQSEYKALIDEALAEARAKESQQQEAAESGQP